MNLMPDEKVLLQSPGKSLILTTHRIRHEVSGVGVGSLTSIMLEELASCSLTRRSHPALLFLAAACFTVGLLISATQRRAEAALVVAAAIALIFLIAYFVTRHQYMTFASAGGSISVPTGGVKTEVSKNFIEQAEAAKNM